MKNWTSILEWFSILGLVSCGFWIFWGTPIEKEMGLVQKIMYLHIPSVLATYTAFFVTFVFSIAYLWKREPYFDYVAESSAEIGLIFCGMVLVTGAIWGKPTWGTYWVWDARLTTTLLLFLIFIGYFLLRMFAVEPQKEARFAAVIAIIGFLDIPIIHQSVKWWRTLHQPTTLFKVESGQAQPSIPNELLFPLLACLGMVLVFYAYLLNIRVQLAERKTEFMELTANEQFNQK